MHWTPRGARPVLQVHTILLNHQLAGDFRR